MVLATVPDALPTWKNQRATSCPAPISANVPYFFASRLICNAFCPVFNFSSAINFPARDDTEKTPTCPSLPHVSVVAQFGGSRAARTVWHTSARGDARPANFVIVLLPVFQLSARRFRAILVFMYRTQDLHVKEIVRLSTPNALKVQTPTTEAANATVARSRERVIRILRQEDPRLLVVIGPCSIHDEKSALEYATRLNALRKEFADRMEIVMRVYFEKPRTTIGWKGLINDP